MKNSFSLVAVILMVTISCQKDSSRGDVIKTMSTDNESHSFINDNGKHYYENTLTSQKDIHRYELKMIKGVIYRISASQPEALINQVKLTLVNAAGDTLSESSNEGGSKSAIVIKSPETTNYYLKVGLFQRTNPQFIYRLYFEELTDNITNISGKEWQTSGIWTSIDMTSVELSNSDSRIYRHLKLNTVLTGNPNVSFTLTSDNIINFGLITEASNDLIQFSEYAYEFPSICYAFVAFKNASNFTIMRMNQGSISLDWGTLSNVNLDFTSGIKVEMKNVNGQYIIYLNGAYLKNISGSLKNFYIVVQDTGNGKTKIQNLQIL